MNPQLANVMTAAKKANVPKATIENAIARGQGRTATGAALESMTFELMMPPSVAFIVDIETESKLKVLHEMSPIAKRTNANITSTKFFFSRLGRVVFKVRDGVGVDEIMDDAIEAGAEDITTDGEGNILVWVQPTLTNQVAKAVGTKFKLEVLGADIIWSPNDETKVEVGSSDELDSLMDLARRLRDYPDVQAIYTNAVRGKAGQEDWEKFEELVD